jgi:hypothetical protein
VESENDEGEPSPVRPDKSDRDIPDKTARAFDRPTTRNYFRESSAVPAGTGFLARTLSLAKNNSFERIGLVM